MNYGKVLRAVVGGALLLSGAVALSAPNDLNDLLDQTRLGRAQQAELAKQRDARFLADRGKQAAILADARAQLAEQQKTQAGLKGTFEDNQKKIAGLHGEIEKREGGLSELFGVARQVANDFSSVVRNSLVTAQYPDREGSLTKIMAPRSIPSIQDLERFWFELQREMTESGSVVKYKTKIVTPQGSPADAMVTRVGPFTVSTDGLFLQYLAGQKELAIVARQPVGNFKGIAQKFESTTESVSPGIVDPTRGVMLSIYAQKPNLMERVQRGESVGYLIIFVGLVGTVLAIYQLAYLVGVRRKVTKQLDAAVPPQPDNPLGRVLATFRGDPKQLEEEADIVELRISEAVLKEVPRLERFQAFLRLAVAAGPLLGLIGTVIGMIMTFQSITESGSSDPKLMAAGISQAMIATLLGLGIAIPLLFMNAWLATISRSIVQILDEQSAGLVAERVEAQATGK
jgi:biopolymer transport protein ExbB